MKWWDNFVNWSRAHPRDKEFEKAWEEVKDTPAPEPTTIDVMKDDIDPNEITIENAYKTRWIWYHTILGLLMFFANILLIAIFLLLAIKL